MKTAFTICVVVVCMLVTGTACTVAVKPVECLLVVEKAKRFIKDYETARYVENIMKENNRDMRGVH